MSILVKALSPMISLELPDFHLGPRSSSENHIFHRRHHLSVSARRIAWCLQLTPSTYSMNILQHLPEAKHGLVLVTLNPPFPVDPAKTVGRYTYHHPMMTQQSVSSQSLLPSIQNTRHISYAGAWTKYGFHEDGFASAMRLVCAPPFNVKPPFPILPAARPIPSPDAVTTLARYLVMLLETSRRELEWLWPYVCWVAVAASMWVERVLRTVAWTQGADEVVRIRGCWVSSTADRKRR